MTEVCRFHTPKADITHYHTESPVIHYLRVAVPDDHSVPLFPVGAYENGVDQTRIDAFVTHVDALYRAANNRVVSHLVYSGPAASEDLVAYAQRHGVRLQSFVEYQGLMDFSHYLDRQTQRLANDPIYPPNLYVPQHLHYGIGIESMPLEATAGNAPSPGDSDVILASAETPRALDDVARWLTEPHSRFVLLLGDFGTGKTFLLRQLTQYLTQTPGAPVPILMKLRSLQKVRTLNELVAQQLIAGGECNIDIDKFRYMLANGRIALLFDGFDELAHRVTYDRAAEHFDTL